MQSLLNDVKHHSGRIIIFSDEKLFRVDRVLNHRNSRYISSQKTFDVPANVKHVFTTKHLPRSWYLGLGMVVYARLSVTIQKVITYGSMMGHFATQPGRQTFFGEEHDRFLGKKHVPRPPSQFIRSHPF